MARIRRSVTLAAFAAVSLLAAACDDAGGADVPEPVEGLADAYVAVLDSMLPEPPSPDEAGVLYVWEFGEQTMSLDDQVVVIDHFDGTYDVRFVDELGAAVDTNATSVPARDDGLLVGLGPVTRQDPHTVRVEIYTSEDSVVAHVVTIDRRGDTWTVIDDEPVEPEVLGGVV